MKQRCLRCRLELHGIGERALARALVEAFLGSNLIVEAVEAALLASARTGTRPTRRSVRYLALRRLRDLVDRELDRRLRQLEQEQERAA